MLSFKQKISLTYLAIFFLFAIFLYPIVTMLVDTIHERNLLRRVHVLVKEIQHAPDQKSLIEQLQERDKFIFFRITLYEPSQGYLFDSYEGDERFQEEESHDSAAEIQKALVKGSAYEVRYSSLFGEQMAFVALSFPFEGKKYVIRAAFPNGQIDSLTHDLTFTFLIFVLLLLLLFSLFAWFMINYLTRPVYQILSAIKPYQEGKEDHIREIRVENQIGEFGKLAATLNSLSEKVEHQIQVLTHEKNEKAAILESLVEGVVAVDADMNVIYMNRMAEIFLDIQKQKLIGSNFSLVGQVECEKLIRKAQESNEPVASILKPQRKQKRFFDVVAVPRRYQEGAILVLQDKTSLHKVVEMGRDFIANASHELKTPITIIRGFAETLHDHPELSKDICVEITQKIVSNCARMETLVKNLLTLAAVDEKLPRSRLQECDLVDLVEQAKQTTLAVHPQAQITIETRGKSPFCLMLDSDLFLQAILNLLDNAAKYSKPPAIVTVRIIKGERQFAIQVADQGIGIPKEDIDRIFERFYAVDKSHSRSMGGSGLGLSIVESIIEKHDGKIEVDSEKGKGTTFIITLPVDDDDVF